MGCDTWTENTGEILAHSHKLLVLAYTDRVLSSTQILLPQPSLAKINCSYIVTHITTTPQIGINKQFL